MVSWDRICAIQNVKINLDFGHLFMTSRYFKDIPTSKANLAKILSELVETREAVSLT